MRLKNVSYIIRRQLPQVGYINLISEPAGGVILPTHEEPFRRTQEPTGSVGTFLIVYSGSQLKRLRNGQVVVTGTIAIVHGLYYHVNLSGAEQALSGSTWIC
jgi:hypothetical protein